MAQKKGVYISVQGYLGKTQLLDLSKELIGNVNSLIPVINEVLERFGTGRRITSGYRSNADHLRIYAEINKKRAVDKKPELKIPMGSAHLVCLAVDLEDADGKLDRWCVDNIDWLTSIGVYMEHPDHTLGWTHLQLRAPKSGNNPFIP